MSPSLLQITLGTLAVLALLAVAMEAEAHLPSGPSWMCLLCGHRWPSAGALDRHLDRAHHCVCPVAPPHHPLCPRRTP